MPVTMFKKEQLSIPYDVDKCRINNRRYNAFIKSCIKDLKTKGETICFNTKQIEKIFFIIPPLYVSVETDFFLLFLLLAFVHR